MNPRVQLWLDYIGRTSADIARRSGEDIPHIGSSRLPWTYEYSEWIMAQWTAWAGELGFKHAGGTMAHRRALMAGHTDDEFDAWLEKRVREALALGKKS